MISITIHSERYKTARVIVMDVEDAEKVAETIDHAYENQAALQLTDKDGVVVYIPYISLEFVTEIIVKEMQCPS